ncbi:polysaccharide deacetylase family protein [Profundibacter sp.]
MLIDWSPVTREFAHWRAAGLTLPIWWRDDDAVAATPALEKLVAMSKAVGVPVHLAVIPDMADAGLAARVADAGCLIPVVHGWAHQNHAAANAKKAEFGAGRGDVSGELQSGMSRLQTLFGDRLKPMFVPPWNRISPDYYPALIGAGFSALSTYTPRKHPHAAAGLQQINTHLDPIAWRKGKTLIDPDELVSQLAKLLLDRRTGVADNDEPLGLLTHHLVHDADVWEFTRQVLTILQDGPVMIYR